MSRMSTLVKQTETLRKTKINNLLKTKRILNMKMSAEVGPVFTFSLPGRWIDHLPSVNYATLK